MTKSFVFDGHHWVLVKLYFSLKTFIIVVFNYRNLSFYALSLLYIYVYYSYIAWWCLCVNTYYVSVWLLNNFRLAKSCQSYCALPCGTPCLFGFPINVWIFSSKDFWHYNYITLIYNPCPNKACTSILQHISQYRERWCMCWFWYLIEIRSESVRVLL